MTKLLILDKDGTLARPKSGNTFVQHPEDQELLPGVADAVSRYAKDGWGVAIASNQGGVIAGYKTLEATCAEMIYCLNLLPVVWHGVRVYFCPDNGDTCMCGDWRGFENLSWRIISANYRKPGTGMIDMAIQEAFYKPPESLAEQVLFVGDRPEDEEAAQAAGVPFQWAHDWRGDRPYSE